MAAHGKLPLSPWQLPAAPSLHGSSQQLPASSLSLTPSITLQQLHHLLSPSFTHNGISTRGMKTVDVYSRTGRLDDFPSNTILELLSNKFCEGLKAACDAKLAALVRSTDDALLLVDYVLEETAHVLVAACLRTFFRDLPFPSLFLSATNPGRGSEASSLSSQAKFPIVISPTTFPLTFPLFSFFASNPSRVSTKAPPFLSSPKLPPFLSLPLSQAISSRSTTSSLALSPAELSAFKGQSQAPGPMSRGSLGPSSGSQLLPLHGCSQTRLPSTSPNLRTPRRLKSVSLGPSGGSHSGLQLSLAMHALRKASIVQTPHRLRYPTPRGRLSLLRR